MIEALLGFAAIFALTLVRMPLAFSMGLVGIAGIGLTRGWDPALASAAQVVHETGFAYTLSVIPLFILMGNFRGRLHTGNTRRYTAINSAVRLGIAFKATIGKVLDSNET